MTTETTAVAMVLAKRKKKPEASFRAVRDILTKTSACSHGGCLAEMQLGYQVYDRKLNVSLTYARWVIPRCKL
jgi:hypothetical protein